MAVSDPKHRNSFGERPQRTGRTRNAVARARPALPLSAGEAAEAAELTLALVLVGIADGLEPAVGRIPALLLDTLEVALLLLAQVAVELLARAEELALLVLVEVGNLAELLVEQLEEGLVALCNLAAGRDLGLGRVQEGRGLEVRVRAGRRPYGPLGRRRRLRDGLLEGLVVDVRVEPVGPGVEQ